MYTGQSIAFYGTTPPSTSSQTFSVSIDGSAPSTVSYGDPDPPTYRQWFQSPELSAGRHNITVDMLDGAMFDFAAVAASPDTPLNGKRLIVNDDSPLIQYHGSWKRSTAGFHSNELTDGLPFRNGTHQSWNAGDGLSFTFTGIYPECVNYTSNLSNNRDFIGCLWDIFLGQSRFAFCDL